MKSQLTCLETALIYALTWYASFVTIGVHLGVHLGLKIERTLFKIALLVLQDE